MKSFLKKLEAITNTHLKKSSINQTENDHKN